jgi:hypothetical protein
VGLTLLRLSRESISSSLDVGPLERLVRRLDLQLERKKASKFSNVVTSGGAPVWSIDPDLTTPTMAPLSTPAPQPPTAAPSGATRITVTIAGHRPAGGCKKFTTIAAIKEHGRANPSGKHILDVQENVLHEIFKKVLIKDADYICPFYCRGFKPAAPTFNDAELDVIKKHGPPLNLKRELQNIDIGLFRANALFNNMGSTVYYSENVFVFNDARSCQWFLQKIGDMNTSRLRKVVFNISSGFFLSMEHRSAFDICEERRWCHVFRSLRFKHRFDSCVIRFFGFNDLEERDDLWEMDKIVMSQARIDLVPVLSSLRGMKEVRIENDQCEFLGLYERNQMAQSMVVSKPSWQI